MRKRDMTKREAAQWRNALRQGMENQFGDLRERKGIAAPVLEEVPNERAPRKKSTEPSEHQLQQAVIEWWDTFRKLHGLPKIALFAVPNGSVLRGNRVQRAIQMNRMKAEGFRNGVPDLFLMVPRGGMHGCAIEMKTPDGVVSEDQWEYVKFLQSQKYHVGICRSTEQAIDIITAYILMK